jgi:hypothetical protein
MCSNCFFPGSFCFQDSIESLSYDCVPDINCVNKCYVNTEEGDYGVKNIT